MTIEKVLEIDPKNAWARYVFSGVLSAAGKCDEAAVQLEKATEHADRRWTFDRAVWLIQGFVPAGRQADARKHLERQAEEWPEDPWSWTNLAWFLATVDGEDRGAALAAARKAVETSYSGGPQMMAVLAEAQFASGMAKEAVASAREAIELMEGRDVRWLRLAEMQRRLARYQSK